MKRINVVLLSAIVVVIVLLAWFKLTKPNLSGNPATGQNVETNQPTNQQQQTSKSAVILVSSPPETNILLQDTFNPLTATNLDQWKAATKGLKYSDVFYQNTEIWDMEQTNRRTGLPFLLIKGRQAVQYKAAFVDVSAKKPGGDLIETQMQTPNMSIDETRKLGLQLCNILEVDPKDFLTWCDKVGNHWMDAPLYATNHFYGFGINRTYDNEKPWLINFTIEHQ